MSFKRIAALILSLLLMLTILPGVLPAALAWPSEAGCSKSPNEKHDWSGPRYRAAWCEWSEGNVWVCSFCGKEAFEETGPALGHDWPAWTVTKAATCTQKGERTRTCNRCHKVETGTIAALGHYFPNPWKTVKEPTATEPGQEVNYCARCGYEWRRELPATGVDEEAALSITLWSEDWNTTEKKTEFKDGEEFSFVGSVKNTGNVDIELYDSDHKMSTGWSLNSEPMPSRHLLKPGETVVDWDGCILVGVYGKASLETVTPGTETETLAGTITYTATVRGYKPGTDEILCTATNSTFLGVLKPEEEPEPGLEIKWEYDKIYHNGIDYTTTEPGVLAPNDGALAHITLKNTGNVDLKPMTCYSFLDGYNNAYIWPVMNPDDEIPFDVGTSPLTNHLTPGSETAELLGTVAVTCWAVGYDPDTGEELCKSNEITRTWKIGKENAEEPDNDFCSLTLNSLGDTGAQYNLHTCCEHLITAEVAEAMARSGDWASAAELWRADLEALYESLDGDWDEAETEILNAEKESLFAYADAVQALYGDEAAANLLRLRCAQLCCILHTAPERLPSSLAGEWEALDTAGTYEASLREIGALDGSDCAVTERYAGPVKEAMVSTLSLIDTASDILLNEAFAEALDRWKTVLDDTANQAYKVSDKATRALIGNWRMSLTMVCDADEEFYALFYADDPAMTQELLMDLYRDAALLADGIR